MKLSHPEFSYPQYIKKTGTTTLHPLGTQTLCDNSLEKGKVVEDKGQSQSVEGLPSTDQTDSAPLTADSTQVCSFTPSTGKVEMGTFYVLKNKRV